MINRIDIEPGQLYSVRGSFANNTTIDEWEKSMIAGQHADSATGQRDRCRFAGEQAMAAIAQEFGLAPKARVYTDYEGIDLAGASVLPRTSINELGTDRGRISKSTRNLRAILAKKQRNLR